MNEPTTNRPTTTSATSTLAEVQRLRAEVARLAGELTPTVSEAARMSYLQRVGQLRMAELAAGEIVRSQNPPSRENGAESVAEDLELEALEAPQLPDDPAHPLNDPARLEAMSTEEYLALLEQWHQSPQYQQAESAAAGWRDRL